MLKEQDEQMLKICHTFNSQEAKYGGVLILWHIVNV